MDYLVLVEHYTDNRYWEPMSVTIDCTPFSIKPNGALYTSPVGSNHSWSAWCAENNYGKGSYRVEIEIDPSRLFIVSGYDSMMRLPWEVTEACKTLNHINYSKLILDGFTGVWLTEHGEYITRLPPGTRNLYGWDCETVAIMDTSIILKYRHGGSDEWQRA